MSPHTLRHTFATHLLAGRLRPALPPGDARPRRHRHDAGLHPSLGRSPARRVLRRAPARASRSHRALTRGDILLGGITAGEEMGVTTGLTHFDEAPERIDDEGHIRGRWTALGEAAGVGRHRGAPDQGPPGGWSTPVHDHGREEEIFYVLGGQRHRLASGRDRPRSVRGDCLVFHPRRGGIRSTPLTELDVLAFGPRFKDESAVVPTGSGASFVGTRLVDRRLALATAASRRSSSGRPRSARRRAAGRARPAPRHDRQPRRGRGQDGRAPADRSHSPGPRDRGPVAHDPPQACGGPAWANCRPRCTATRSRRSCS